MDIEDPSSAHCAPDPKNGEGPYSYDLRNPFYHLTNMANFSSVRRPPLVAFIPMALAAIFIASIMYVVG